MRANACKKYLIERGIDPDRIETIGYGPRRTISKSDAAANRRVEMQIISIDN